MGNVATNLSKNLKPPFFTAVMNDNATFAPHTLNSVPSDKLVTLAPAQPGFLGLETSQDNTGKPVTISYWKDLPSIDGWKKIADETIARHFDGASIEDTCQIVVSLVNPSLLARKLQLSRNILFGNGFLSNP